MRRLLAALTLAMIMSLGCATAQKTNLIEVGMAKSEVVEKMGAPDATAANGRWEVLTYYLRPPSDSWLLPGPAQEYYVMLEKGRVASFGRR